jgi:hypothetical protein
VNAELAVVVRPASPEAAAPRPGHEDVQMGMPEAGALPALDLDGRHRPDQGLPQRLITQLAEVPPPAVGANLGVADICPGPPDQIGPLHLIQPWRMAVMRPEQRRSSGGSVWSLGLPCVLLRSHSATPRMAGRCMSGRDATGGALPAS